MKRPLHSSLCPVLSLTPAVSLFFVLVSQVGAATPRERKFEFEYKATVKKIPAGAKRVDLWIPVPHDSRFQKITDMQIESPYRYQIQTAQYGNRILHISLNHRQQSSFTVTRSEEH